ncbi:CPBP family intramembrane glutamic endopeptidase [Haloferax sp. YSMS24]|uniref:CPBP family intramembrane glutamic endopeptidase n=1 Tax=Haloferax sp. YSMS24 TaxID=3388425 RepID=UPI00398CBBC3
MTLDGRPVRTLLVYTLATYAFSWACWGLRAVVPNSDAVTGSVLFVLGGLGPFFVGILMTFAAGRSVQSWLANIFSTRVARRYYVVAFVLPIVVALAAGSVHALAFGGELSLDALPAVVEYPLFLGFIVLFGGGLEEPGWRGYLLPHLQDKYTALVAALLVGLVWAGWHLPLFFLSDTVQNGMPLWLYVAQLIALSVVLTWLTNAAGGSVVPAIVLHAGGNAILNYYPSGGVAGAISPLGLGLLAVVLTMVALALVVYYGPRHLAPSGEYTTVSSHSGD